MPLIKMAIRPNPILALPPTIKKNFEDLDSLTNNSNTQPQSQSQQSPIAISSNVDANLSSDQITDSQAINKSLSSSSSSSSSSSPSPSSSPPSSSSASSSSSSSPIESSLLTEKIDFSSEIKRKSGIEIKVATEQGLLPKIISVPTQQTIKSMGERRPQNSPRFLIIVDFEATCDFAPSPLVTNQTSEIIEFPWVVLDTKTLEIIHQNRFYVRPDNLDGITRYCKALTGITRQECESGIPLSQAISIFDDFVRREMIPLGPKNFRIVTDGVWDLQVQLLQEAARKHIPLEWWYREYFDLKAEFRNTYSWFSFTNQGPPLFVMLQSFGLDFVGRHHSGLDDCKTICQVVRVLLQICPHSFTHAHTIPADYDPYQDDSWHQFMNRCPVESWQCINQECLVWNNPRQQVCNFCQTPPRPN